MPEFLARQSKEKGAYKEGRKEPSINRKHSLPRMEEILAQKHNPLRASDQPDRESNPQEGRPWIYQAGNERGRNNAKDILSWAKHR